MSLFKLPCVTQTDAAHAQDRRDELLHGRLAAAARDCDDRVSRSRAPGTRERTERAPRIAHLDLRQRRVARLARRARLRRLSRARHAGSRCRRSLSPAIATNKAPAVSARLSVVTAPNPPSAPIEPPVVFARDGGQRARHHARPPSSSAATARSSNGAPLRAYDLLRLVTFARDQHDVAGPRCSSAARIAARRSWITPTSRMIAHAAADVAHDRRQDPRCAGCRRSARACRRAPPPRRPSAAACRDRGRRRTRTRTRFGRSERGSVLEHARAARRACARSRSRPTAAAAGRRAPPCRPGARLRFSRAPRTRSAAACPARAVRRAQPSRFSALKSPISFDASRADAEAPPRLRASSPSRSARCRRALELRAARPRVVVRISSQPAGRSAPSVAPNGSSTLMTACCETRQLEQARASRGRSSRSRRARRDGRA